MKSKSIRALIYTLIAFAPVGDAQDMRDEVKVSSDIITITPAPPKRTEVNFFVISKRKKGRFDLATKYNMLRSKIKSVLHKNSFVSLVAKNGDDMCIKVINQLEKQKASIGTIWFDSHGMYKKGYSLFFIGSDEYNFKSVKEAFVIDPFKKLSLYTTQSSKFIIGSCYGGATFKRLTNSYRDTVFMKGDSLMISIGKLLKNGVIYGAESWVMSRPGLFQKKMVVNGSPGRKIFHDVYYKPAWENIGRWNKYVIDSKNFQPANAISLDARGSLVEHPSPYHLKKKYRKKIKKIIATLKPGILNLKS